MIRKARAVWRGTGKDGKGELTTDSGVLSSTPYSFKTRFESEKGTNPEELIAAAHAGCFTMALAFQLQGAGVDADGARDGGGGVARQGRRGLHDHEIGPDPRGAKVPGIERAKFEELARAAEKNCPVSKLLKAEITLDWTLA